MPPRRQDSWWKRRTIFEHQLIYLVICCLLLAGILLLSLIYSTVTTTSNDICLSRECVQTAGQIFRSMDETISPCDDFYQFACGNYIKHSLISNDKTFANTFTVINDLLQEQIKSSLEDVNLSCEPPEPKAFQMAKKYYRSCTNKTTIEKHGLNIAKQLLAKLGGWPVLEEYWDKEEFDWMQLVHTLRKYGLGINSLIDVSIGFDFKNSTKRLIHIDQPTLGLSREYLINGLQDNIVRAYYDYMVDIAEMFGADRNRAISELKESLNFEIELAKVSLSQEDRRNITNLYNPMTVAQIQSKYKKISWLKLINTILPGNVQISNEQAILLGVPIYVNAFEELICQTPKRIQANYMMWRIVKDIISYLNQEVKDRELIFRHSISGIQENPPRWKECVEETTTLLPIIIGSMYIRRYFHVDAKENAVEMVKYIKHQFKSILCSIDWMDDETKRSALAKANTIVDHIAYPDELLDDRKIEEMYQSLEIDESQFLYSTLNISRYMTDYTLSRLRDPVNKTDWREHGFPAQVNAFYHPLENSITFPAGILQDVFFNKDRPRYMNFGAIGSVIGHEITHGFDDTGRQFDKDGNLVNWWQETTKTAFLNRAQCIIEQYENYSVPEVKMKLNGVKTQGENIADNGGVKQAYLAYLTWEMQNRPEPKMPGLKYTPRQLFWISAAQIWCSKHRKEAVALQVTIDVHSPAEFRVLGPFSNSPYFARDFDCPVGTKMNPAKKCSVW